MLADVSGKLITQFAACLADEIGQTPQPQTAVSTPTRNEALPGADAAPAVSSDGADPQPRQAEPASGPVPAPPRPAGARPSAEAIDLLGTAGGPVLKRLAPVLGGLGLLLLLLWRRRSSLG